MKPATLTLTGNFATFILAKPKTDTTRNSDYANNRIKPVRLANLPYYHGEASHLNFKKADDAVPPIQYGLDLIFNKLD